MKKLHLIILVVVVVSIGIQFIPMDRTNPPGTNELTAPPQVMAVLKKACYNCHSHETVWPWYSRIAPVSWLIAHDVSEGRHHVNFSLWGTLSSEKQDRTRREVWEEVEDDEMPPWVYVLGHPEAKLSEEDKTILKRWADGTINN